jgi:hypothetical protein
MALWPARKSYVTDHAVQFSMLMMHLTLCSSMALLRNSYKLVPFSESPLSMRLRFDNLKKTNKK